MTRVAITGANGFVGSALVGRLVHEPGLEIVSLVRRVEAGAQRWPYRIVGDLTDPDYGAGQLQGIDVLVHSAARVHVMQDRSADPLGAFRRSNVEGTLALARHAVDAGVRRFVFISSLKVHGEVSPSGRPIRADDPVAPVDPYGISKREAEDGLRAFAARTGLELVIVRPPLVYGKMAGGNFAILASWLSRGRCLPLGGITENRRSLVAIDNLADLLSKCVVDPRAAGLTFLVSDGEDLSTAELVRRMSAAMGKRACLLPFPPRLLNGIAALAGKEAMAQRLTGSLRVDISQTRSRLSWAPPLSVNAALERALHHLGSRDNR